MDAKALGIVQLIGAVVASYFGYKAMDWGVLTLSIVILVMAFHHFTEKTTKK